jgi:hypothetical protein
MSLMSTGQHVARLPARRLRQQNSSRGTHGQPLVSLSMQLERSGPSFAVQADGLPIPANDDAYRPRNPVLAVVEIAAVGITADVSQRGSLCRSPGCGRAGSRDKVGRLRRTTILGAASHSFSLSRRECDRAAAAPRAIQARGLGSPIIQGKDCQGEREHQRSELRLRSRNAVLLKGHGPPRDEPRNAPALSPLRCAAPISADATRSQTHY